MRGHGLHERGAALHQMRRQLHHSQQRARELEDRLAETSALLIAPGLAPTERATVVVELEQLTEEKLEVARSIDAIEHDYAAAELDYELPPPRRRPAGRLTEPAAAELDRENRRRC